MTVQAVPDKWAQDRAGSWGNFGIAFRKVSLPTSLGQYDVVKVMELPAGIRVHAVKVKAIDAGASSSTVDVGYGTDAEFAAYDAASSSATRTAAWANAKRQAFFSALATGTLDSLTDSRSDAQEEPVAIEQSETAYNKDTGEPSHVDPQYLALACTTDPTNAAELGITVEFEFEGN